MHVFVFIVVFVIVFVIVGVGSRLATMIYSTVFSLQFTCNSVQMDRADALKSWVCKVFLLEDTFLLVYNSQVNTCI